MDFVVKLSESMEFNTVITVINSMSKRIYFILIYTAVIMKGATRLFLCYV